MYIRATQSVGLGLVLADGSAILGLSYSVGLGRFFSASSSVEVNYALFVPSARKKIYASLTGVYYRYYWF